MQTTGNVSEYLAFMEWLQATHTDVYFASWGFISEPTNDDSFVTVKQGLDEGIYNAVMDAQFEFYKTLQTSTT